MPIYEYQCKSCGFEFETIQKISEDPLKDCPECGLVELRKLVSKAAFRLKGGGWYETDFKSGDKKNVHGAESKSDTKSDSSSKSEGKSDSKPKSDTGSKSDSKSKSDGGSKGGGASSASSSSGT